MAAVAGVVGDGGAEHGGDVGDLAASAVLGVIGVDTDVGAR
ncbi:MAG: hypothetical protein ABSB76_18145 [Streptosporangiaceae bacterium]